MTYNPYSYPKICSKCGRPLSICECYQQWKDTDYIEYLRKLTGQKAVPAIDYDILAERVAAKVVALLGKKKKRRAAR